MDNNKFKKSLASNPDKPLTLKVVYDYASRLKRVPVEILMMKDPGLFYKIDNPKTLKKILGTLESNPKLFKSIPKGSQGDILTAFRTYIRYIEKLHALKLLSNRYVKELNLSYYDFKKKATDKKKAAKSIVTKLSRLFEPGRSATNWGKPLCDYLKLKNEKDVKILYKVSKNLLSGKYNEMVFAQFEKTAKIMAIKKHMKHLKTEKI